jgi:hypothetical protein
MNDNINMDNTIAASMNDNINMDNTIAASMNDSIHMDNTIAGSMNDKINMDNTIAGLMNDSSRRIGQVPSFVRFNFLLFQSFCFCYFITETNGTNIVLSMFMLSWFWLRVSTKEGRV